MGDQRIVVLISSNSEWRAVKEILAPSRVQSTPPGETFGVRPFTYFHGGWGKISAAATTQYVIDHFQPTLLVNLGTCGGFEGCIARGTVILVTKTIVYDIFEQMSDTEDAIAHYSTELDLSWLNDRGPQTADHGQSSIVRGLLVSADRDIVPADIPGLVQKYGAVAADWESGAIAWVAQKNKIKCLILRGVTDLVSAGGGEAYGNIELFHENTKSIMKTLIDQLPVWLEGIE
ncbi:MAG: 5'-methylthioadenosine/S-adenosylhomocysteine nucleosidase [Anaerolineales bacterium]